MVYPAQIQRRESGKMLKNSQRRLYFLAEAIPGYIYTKFCPCAYKCSKYDVGFYNSMINDKDGHIPSPLIMLTCTALSHALLEWQKNKGVYPKASKSKQKAGRPQRSNYFNYKNVSGKDTSWGAPTGRKLLTTPGIADTYTLLMNSWYSQLESYQHRVYQILLLQSSIRSNMRRTQCLPWSSGVLATGPDNLPAICV